MTKFATRKNILVAIATLGLLVAILLAVRSAHRNDNVNGSQVITVRHDDLDRKCLLHIPDSVKGKSNIPLLIYLHGSATDPKDYAETTQFDCQANIIGFMVAYPYGVNLLWNSDKPASDSLPDDVGFISALIDELSNKYKIDKNRVFISGHSNGAFMTYRLGVELPNEIAGIAPIAGSIDERMIANLDRPLKLVHTHAIDDDAVSILGSSGFMPVDDVVNKWSVFNRCVDSAEVSTTPGLTIKKWESETGHDVQLNLYDRGRHSWPNDPVNASKIICEAFFNFSDEEYSFDFTYPKNNAYTFTYSAKISIQPKEPGKIARVGYYLDNQLISESVSPPFSVDLRMLGVGQYFISALAYDEAGEVRAYEQIDFSIIQPCLDVAIETDSSSLENKRGLAEYAVDNDLYTRWSSEFEDNEWIALKLAEPTAVNGITIFWEYAYAASYKVQTSTDMTNWVDIAETNGGDGNMDYLTFDSIKTKYIRVLCVKRGTHFGNSIWEIKLHNASSE